MLFEMYAKVKMDRPITTDSVVSPGSFSIMCDKMLYTFDFTLTTTTVEEDDPSIITFTCKYPDTEAFPLAEKITAEVLHSITNFSEFFIYSGEPDENTAMPLKLLECEFYIPDTDESIEVPKEICNGAYVTKGN